MSRKVKFVNSKSQKPAVDLSQEFKKINQNQYRENPKELKKMIKEETKDVVKEIKTKEEKEEKEFKETEKKKAPVKNSELISAVSRQILNDVLGKNKKGIQEGSGIIVQEK